MPISNRIFFTKSAIFTLVCRHNTLSKQNKSLINRKRKLKQSNDTPHKVKFNAVTSTYRKLNKHICFLSSNKQENIYRSEGKLNKVQIENFLLTFLIFSLCANRMKLIGKYFSFSFKFFKGKKLSVQKVEINFSNDLFQSIFF